MAGAVELMVIDWSLFGLSTFFVFFRLWIRVRRLWRLTLSDYFILSSWLGVGMVASFNTIIFVMQKDVAKPGLTRTMSMLLMPMEDIMISARIIFAMNITYVFLMWLVKASFLSLLAPPYLSLPRPYRILFWGVCLYNILTFVVILCLNIFWCWPISRNWTIFPLTEYCTSALVKEVFIITFVLHITTDLTVLILPLFIISSLGMQSRREHAGIAFVFLIGGLSVAASVVRCAVAFHSGTFDVMSSLVTSQLEIWTPVEQNAAVIAACLPSMRVLIRRATQSVRAHSNRHGSQGTDKNEKSQGKEAYNSTVRSNVSCEHGYAGSEVELNTPESSWRRSTTITWEEDDDIDPSQIAIAR